MRHPLELVVGSKDEALKQMQGLNAWKHVEASSSP